MSVFPWLFSEEAGLRRGYEKGDDPMDVRERLIRIRIIEKLKGPALMAYGSRLGIKDVSKSDMIKKSDNKRRKNDDHYNNGTDWKEL